jgi:CBS domain containing-hemolysin-like protein
MSSLHPLIALALSVLILALSAFFVAVEFALVAARRYRLEDAARTSAAARAALRSARDLSILLAGSQLGITLCTLALGAVSKPAVQHLLQPLFGGWLPTAVSYMVAFVLSLLVVTFLHLVVGEMAPKSWAITHPERSATLLAPPMRLFIAVTRPALLALNWAANRVLRLFGVSPVDEVASGHNPDDLRQLVDHSARAGTLDEERRQQLAGALEVNSRPLREVVTPIEELAAVAPDATGPHIVRRARETGHVRLVVGDAQEPRGVIHVRDALTGGPEATAEQLMREVLTLDAALPAYTALSRMRESRSHLALVRSDGRLIGLVTLQDLIDQLLVGAS